MLHKFHDPLLALHEITLNLLTDGDPDSLLETLLDHAIEFTGADTGTIALLDRSRQFLEIRAFRGLDKDVPEKVKLKLGEGVTGRCILTGKTRNIGDTTQDPHYVEIKKGIRSELAVPLRIGNKTFGVISVDSNRLQAFNDNHVELLEILASHAAQIFSNHQTVQTLNHRTRVQEVLLEIWPVITRHAELQKVFHEIIELLQKRIELRRSAIFMYDEVPGELYIVAGTDYSDEEKQRGRYKPGEGVTGTVFRNSQVISIPDISKDKIFLNKSGHERAGEKLSFFASPIILSDKVRGVFSMELPYRDESSFEDYAFLVQILSNLIAQAIRIQELIEQSSSEVAYENIVLRRELHSRYGFENIIGSSPRMTDLYKKMRMAADSGSSVLLVGESGTGKELIASALHQNSLRREHTMVRLNCAAIPADLLESELFGYTRGAFTGANEDRKGKILVAHKGTLFLDEIGEMDLRLQSKLLRFLQEKEFTPLGSNQVFKVDVRIIAATNRDLEKMIRENLFREDLYYRLNVIRFEIPPLRDRRDDLPLLISALSEKICKANRKKTVRFSPEALTMLENYSFPGNIRELENILERAIVLSEGSVIDDVHIALPAAYQPGPATLTTETKEAPAPAGAAFSLKGWISARLAEAPAGEYRNRVVSAVEKELIMILLQKNFFNKSRTARALGINRLTLDKKIQELEIMADFQD